MTAPTSGRRVSSAEIVPPVGARDRFILGQLAVAAAYVTLFVCAGVPTWAGVLVGALAVTGAEIAVLSPGSFPGWALRWVGLGPVGRGLLRGVALVLLAARATTPTVTVVTAAAVTLLAVVRTGHVAAARTVAHLRKPPVAARGLDLPLPALPPAPHRSLMRIDTSAPAADLLGAAAVAVPAAGGSGAAAVTGWVVLVLAGAVAPAVLGNHVLGLWRLRIRSRVSDAVEQRLAELRPEVIAYLGNGAEWRYQLEMWLSTLEAMPQRVLLLVRDHEVLRTLAPTSLPVVSIPSGTTLMSSELPGLRTVLYVGNTAANLHLLRRPGVRSVFIGHGDSDKGASANPFARAYHEIWVAGPAGRDRYAAAGVDLPDSAFVEVGRPQLRELRRRPEADQRPTVLYAPTWEGWGEDEYHSSLPHLGPQLIRALLTRGDVRVMYRPHPRTGHRDPATRAAHLEILRLLALAGARAPDDTGVEPPPAAGGGPSGDLLELIAAPSTGWSRPEHDAAVLRWTDAFWAAHPGHRILTTPLPDLHACFEVADALIADISSVPNDFLAADRPYAIVNCTGMSAEEFLARSATARGGFVLEPDLAALDALVHAASGAPDPTAVARKQARDYLLGPRTADPAARFRQELERICAQPILGAAPAER